MTTQLAQLGQLDASKKYSYESRLTFRFIVRRLWSPRARARSYPLLGATAPGAVALIALTLDSTLTPLSSLWSRLERPPIPPSELREFVDPRRLFQRGLLALARRVRALVQQRARRERQESG